MKLQELLTSKPIDLWKAKQVYSYDWYDGPREGVCSLADPLCEFYFELLDERYNPDGLDDRLFRLSELPLGSVKEVLSAAHDLPNPSANVRREAEQRLERVNAKKRATLIVIYTQDMEQFLGCWQIDPAQTKVADWFGFLAIPQVQPMAED